jgi:hypothetical protein
MVAEVKREAGRLEAVTFLFTTTLPSRNRLDEPRPHATLADEGRPPGGQS